VQYSAQLCAAKPSAPVPEAAKADKGSAPSLTPRRAGNDPSFECSSGAKEQVEILICADADLAEADRRMGQLYRQRLNAQPGLRDETIRQQRDWIKERAAQCGFQSGSFNSAPETLAGLKPCVLKRTRDRITQLQ
jgi:uncharacterized protein YecT (DUF1311 family)